MTEYTKWQCEVEARLSFLEERCGLRGAIKPEDLNLEKYKMKAPAEPPQERLRGFINKTTNGYMFHTFNLQNSGTPVTEIRDGDVLIPAEDVLLKDDCDGWSDDSHDFNFPVTVYVVRQKESE